MEAPRSWLAVPGWGLARLMRNFEYHWQIFRRYLVRILKRSLCFRKTCNLSPLSMPVHCKAVPKAGSTDLSDANSARCSFVRFSVPITGSATAMVDANREQRICSTLPISACDHILRED